MSLTINSLSKSYIKTKVLDEISFHIGEGEIVGFMGPNGAGKSTTMKIITGALAYNSGSVKVCGVEVKDNPLLVKSNIGYLPENNPLYLEMYIKEYLEFVANTHCLKENTPEKVSQVIKKVGLENELHKKIGQLSKGFKQRVGLAQALIHDPKVLVLDEPTTGLDPNQLIEIRNLIREIGKDKTVLLSTHILQEISAICNRVIIINKGVIAGDYTDLSNFTTYNNSLCIEVEFLKHVSKNDISKISGIIEMNQLSENHYFITSELDIRSKFFDFAVENNNKILTMKVTEKGLEEAFRTLTR